MGIKSQTQNQIISSKKKKYHLEHMALIPCEVRRDETEKMRKTLNIGCDTPCPLHYALHRSLVLQVWVLIRSSGPSPALLMLGLDAKPTAWPGTVQAHLWVFS